MESVIATELAITAQIILRRLLLERAFEDDFRQVSLRA